MLTLVPLKQVKINQSRTTLERSVLERYALTLSYCNYELHHEKTRFLPMRKLRRSCAVTAQLISAFVFASRIVQSLFFLNPKFYDSSLLLRHVQANLCQTWSEAHKISFLMLLLKCKWQQLSIISHYLV